MKKIITVLILSLLFASNTFADIFTDAIQDLAVVSACKGIYSATEAGGGWYDDPHDYYTPQVMAKRFARESGTKTMTLMQYGVCFNYAQFAWTDIQQYNNWYNQKGMYESQFWLAGVYENPNQIELMSIGTKNDYTRLENGEYIKTYNNSLRNVKTHRLGNQGERATYHAWLWIEREDGVWFWMDPTWTDNLGYVVYGYVRNGEEIQCRPNKDFCIIYPAYLDFLPLPPPMGQKKAPSRTANSTNHQETIMDAGMEWLIDPIDKAMRKTFLDVDYSGMGEYEAVLVSSTIPFSATSEQNFTTDKIGFGLVLVSLLENVAGGCGLEYLHNLEDGQNLHAVLLEINFTRRLFGNFAWYIGGGFGLRFDFASDNCMQEDWQTGPLALKANTGFVINISHFVTKIDVSYNNIYGFSVGAGIGFGWEL